MMGLSGTSVGVSFILSAIRSVRKLMEILDPPAFSPVTKSTGANVAGGADGILGMGFASISRMGSNPVSDFPSSSRYPH